MSLDNLANIKARLGITGSADDALLGLLQESADRWVANHCGRDFEGGTFTEYHPGRSAFVLLRNFPVASVTSVKVDPVYSFGPETELPLATYTVHADRGVVQSLDGPFLTTARRWGLVSGDLGSWVMSPRVVQVTYTTATSAVPGDVKEAYAQLVGHWYRRVKTQVGAGFQNTTQQRYGEAFSSWSVDGVAGLPVPPDIRRVLDAYRTPAV
jgi:hypothetical protein